MLVLVLVAKKLFIPWSTCPTISVQKCKLRNGCMVPRGQAFLRYERKDSQEGDARAAWNTQVLCVVKLVVKGKICEPVRQGA